MCSIEELGSTRDMYPEAPEYGIYIFAEDEVKPGDDAIKALGLDDTIVEYEITNNRVDCFSILGIAREAAATFKKEFVPPVVTETGNDEDVNDYVKVSVEDTKLCHQSGCSADLQPRESVQSITLWTLPTMLWKNTDSRCMHMTGIPSREKRLL